MRAERTDPAYAPARYTSRDGVPFDGDTLEEVGGLSLIEVGFCGPFPAGTLGSISCGCVVVVDRRGREVSEAAASEWIKAINAATRIGTRWLQTGA